MTITGKAAESAESAAPSKARPAAILAVLLTAQFMAMLDNSIVTVAAPSVRADLHATGAGLQFIVAGYTLSYAVLLITGARLGDRYGHSRIFRIGIGWFTLASAVCGLAPDAGALMAARLVQGIGAALMMPQVMSLIQRIFSGAARAKALALYGAVIACGAIAGQVAGGLLVSADLFGTGWRPIFLINVPIGVTLWLVGGRLLQRDAGDRGRSLDIAGVLGISVTIALLVVPLVLGRELGWPVWTIVMLALVAPALGGFWRIQATVGARGGQPLLPGTVLRSPGFGWATLVILAMFAAFAGNMLTLALHLQSGLGQSALTVGLEFLPGGVGFAIGGLTWRRLPAAWHRRIVPIGLAVTALGYLLLALILRDGATPGIAFLAVFLVIALGNGYAFSPALHLALGPVPVRSAADASGVLVTVFQVSQVLGVAVFGSVYFGLLTGSGATVSGLAIGTTTVLIAGICLGGAVAATLFIRATRRADPSR